MKKLLVSAAVLSLAAMAVAVPTRCFVPDADVPEGAEIALTLQVDMFGSFTYDLPTNFVGVSGSPLVWGFDTGTGMAAVGNIMSGTIAGTCPNGTPLAGAATLEVPFFYNGNSPTPVVGPTFYGFAGQLDCGPIAGADDLPVEFALANAYPNPFNPTTAIEFSLAETSMTSLKVYNLAGQEVATLVDGTLERGTHSVTFDASALSSGMYLYTIEANGFTATKKMALIK